MKPLFLLAALGATALTGAAFAAQTAPATAVVKPLKGDADKDGKVTRTEYLASAEARFARLDANNDGALTSDEFHAGHGKLGRRFGRTPGLMPPGSPQAMGRGMGGQMLDRLDADKDGKISKAEFAAQSGERFGRMDTNGDGRIDAAERSATAKGARRGGRGLNRLDRDGDGVITRAEYDGQADQRFARLDTNGDGFIDAAERQAAMSRMGRGRSGGDAPPPPPPAPEGN
ncbi:EF-hand domain-containing protein [Sphingomonas sp. DT-204]|uniref:EF-hand domain-containing protein n=1 Tax=Sphingomonas sp. DT-204 TaxID=3396166 RepID=UPI003F1C2501